MQDGLSLALDAVRSALEAKAQGAEVLHTTFEGYDLTPGSDGSPAVRRAVGGRLAVRVWLEGGREGFASGGTRSFERVLSAALAAADRAPRSPGRGPTERTPPRSPIAGLDDQRFDVLTRHDRIEVFELAERAPFSVAPDLEVFDVSYSDRREVRTFVSSRGSRAQERSTRFVVRALVRDPQTDLQLQQVFGDRSFATVASVPFSAGLARRLVDLRGETRLFDGPIRTALSSWAVAQLVRELAPHFSLTSLEGASSFLSRAREGGDLRFSPLVHLVDDGRLPGGLGSRSFDDRGVSPLPLTLIRDGRVEGWWVGLDQARALGVRPTGHEREGRLAANNLIVRSGLRSVNAVLAEQRVPVFVIDHFGDLGGAIDLGSGEIRCRASGCLVGPRNTPQGVVRKIHLSGSLPEILSSVLDLASDTDRFGEIDAAGLLCDGFSAETG